MNLRRAATGAGGWLLTALGVAVIFVVIGGDDRFSGAGRAVVTAAVGLGILVPVIVGCAYMLVRRRNRAAEATPGRPLVSLRARALQTSLASMLDVVNDATDDALGLRRVVLTDRVQLTASTIGELDDRWEALSFIWFVRPSQPADFPRSPQFSGLPVWAQDTVVLLDLRRDLQLRGAARALSAEPGFYHHGIDRIGQAAGRTSALLADLLRDSTSHPDEERGALLLGLLDDPRVWAGLLGEPG